MADLPKGGQPGPDDRLLELAGTIADLGLVDWPSAVSEAASEDERRLLRALRLIADVSAVYEKAGDVPVDPPSSWGLLVLREPLGTGGFGKVYRAYDERLGREVALKLLDGSPATATGLLIEEGRLLARVHHPNVVAVHGADRREGRVGIWMELVRGETLATLVKRQGPCAPREAAVMGIDVCRALAAVHGAGLVHRDVKAQNVMREHGGRIVLMDFGLGVALGGTSPGLAGTPAYLAPEMLLEQAPPSASTDLYALGVLLFHLVTGHLPVEAVGLNAVRESHRRGGRTRLRDARPDVSPAFVAVVERALSAKREERFESAGEMEAALASVASEASEGTHPVPSPPVRPARSSERMAAGLAAVACLAALGALWLASRSPERGRAEGPGAGGPVSSPVPGPTSESSGGDVSHGPSPSTRGESGDPFVRPLLPDVGSAGSDARPEDVGTYAIDASVRRTMGSPRAGVSLESEVGVKVEIKASILIWLYALREERGGLWLVFPLSEDEATNPLEAERLHRLPPIPLRARGSSGTPPGEDTPSLVLIGSPSRLVGFETALARVRLPAADRARGVPLSRSLSDALHQALALPRVSATGRLFAPLPPLRGHPEIVRGTWMRRIAD